MRKYNYKFRQILNDKIKNANDNKKKEILKIIVKNQNKINITENSNGYFVNLNSLDDDIIEEINQILI
jgi:hypothetical protein